MCLILTGKYYSGSDGSGRYLLRLIPTQPSLSLGFGWAWQNEIRIKKTRTNSWWCQDSWDRCNLTKPDRTKDKVLRKGHFTCGVNGMENFMWLISYLIIFRVCFIFIFFFDDRLRTGKLQINPKAKSTGCPRKLEILQGYSQNFSS